MDAKSRLLSVARLYCETTGLSMARVATLAHNQGAFFKRLNAGASCTLETYEKVMRWFSNNWPDGVSWPLDIPRPDDREAA